MRRINITIEIEDNDYIEFALRNELTEKLGSSIKDYTVLTNTDKLYNEDSNFRKIIKGYVSAKKARDKYINEHNNL